MKTITATKAGLPIYKLIDKANESKNPFKLLGKEAQKDAKKLRQPD